MLHNAKAGTERAHLDSGLFQGECGSHGVAIKIAADNMTAKSTMNIRNLTSAARVKHCPAIDCAHDTAVSLAGRLPLSSPLIEKRDGMLEASEASGCSEACV